jgi:hypothetical protein
MMGKIYFIFIELCTKWTFLHTLKGSYSYNIVKICIILESSQTCKYGQLYEMMSITDKTALGLINERKMNIKQMYEYLRY